MSILKMPTKVKEKLSMSVSYLMKGSIGCSILLSHNKIAFGPAIADRSVYHLL
jgi:hypothetical protein